MGAGSCRNVASTNRPARGRSRPWDSDDSSIISMRPGSASRTDRHDLSPDPITRNRPGAGSASTATAVSPSICRRVRFQFAAIHERGRGVGPTDLRNRSVAGAGPKPGVIPAGSRVYILAMHKAILTYPLAALVTTGGHLLRIGIPHRTTVVRPVLCHPRSRRIRQSMARCCGSIFFRYLPRTAVQPAPAASSLPVHP